MHDPRVWYFVGDMNHSGTITISDAWLWFKWLYFYPGDGLIYILADKLPPLAHFLTVSYADYSGFLSGVISFVVWIHLLNLLLGSAGK